MNSGRIVKEYYDFKREMQSKAGRNEKRKLKNSMSQEVFHKHFRLHGNAIAQFLSETGLFLRVPMSNWDKKELRIYYCSFTKNQLLYANYVSETLFTTKRRIPLAIIPDSDQYGAFEAKVFF